MPLVVLTRPPLVSALGSYNNEPTPPIGIAYLAGTLIKAGFPVEVVDSIGEALDQYTLIERTKLKFQGLNIEQIVNRINPAAKIVGISCMFSGEWPITRNLINAIRARLPHAIIVAGGEHPTAVPEHCLEDCPALDACALGEGEEILLEFCQKVAEGKDFRTISSGLIYRDRAGKIVKSTPRNRIRNIDQIPWPVWEIIPIENYFKRGIGFGANFGGRDMPILASRGCPYQCTFCSNPTMWTLRYNLRDPKDLVAEIKTYLERYKITCIQFYDLTAIVKKSWTLEFCRLLKENGFELTWSLPSGTRSEALDYETLKAMSETGCKYLVYAPESGSESTLKIIKKKIELERMIQSMKFAKQLGIVLRANLIIGLPHETRRQIFESIGFGIKMVWIGVEEISLNHFSPYPGSEIFKNLQAKGILKLSDEYLLSLSSIQGSFSSSTVCEKIGPLELFLYRLVFQPFYYLLSYLLYPKRIFRTLGNLFTHNVSATVFEQRIKDIWRKNRMRKSWKKQTLALHLSTS